MTQAELLQYLPGDVIVYKLLYFRQGGSDRHLRDVAGIVAVSGAEPDREYLVGWAAQLGVADLWAAIRRRAEACS